MILTQALVSLIPEHQRQLSADDPIVASIATDGYVYEELDPHPITVRGSYFNATFIKDSLLIDGHRRVLAASSLGITWLPVLIKAANH